MAENNETPINSKYFVTKLILKETKKSLSKEKR